MNETLDEIISLMYGEPQYVVVCEPSRFTMVSNLIAERSWTHVEVRESEFCPVGKVIIINVHADERLLFPINPLLGGDRVEDMWDWDAQ
jgi:hypothetical protein